MGGVKVPQAPRGVGHGEGVYCGKGMVGGCAPPQKIFSYFLLKITYLTHFDTFIS